MSSMALDRMYQSSARRAVEQATREQDRHRDALTVDLQESLAREGVLLREKHALSQRQVTLTQEFEHRLINSLQLIVSLLSLQSRTATTPEAAAQLLVAARRVGALGRVHRRLHLLDPRDDVHGDMTRRRMALQPVEHGPAVEHRQAHVEHDRVGPELAGEREAGVASERDQALVGALGRVHRQLHLLDHEDNVRFKPYLQHLCADLSDLLLQDGSGYAIVVESENVEIPTAFAIPLGFIVNELVTNSAKYAQGNITVGFKATSSDNLSLTVSDDGPGLPTGFDASKCTGLGMKIVLALVKQVGGELHILPGDNGRGTRFAVTFGSRLSPA